MKKMCFSLVDVFSGVRYSGNPLAVFVEVGDLDPAQMQAIAREINFSETTFVRSLQPKPHQGYDVRIFSPTEELPFAGHPTLGTAFVIREQLRSERQEPISTLVLNLAVGPIPVEISSEISSGDVFWMKQNTATIGPVLDNAMEVTAALGLDLRDLHETWPIREVSTGLPFLMVPLRGLGALGRSRVVNDRFSALMAQTTAKGVFLFCDETRDRTHQFAARMFAPGLGIMEDPATGSANGCFAGYWGALGREVDAIVEQGYEMGRPSQVRIRGQFKDGRLQVSVGGEVVAIAQGFWG